MKTVGEEIQVEIKRNQKLVQLYRSIGPEGFIGASFIQQDINRAVKALAEGDVVQILRCYETLKNNNA